MTAKQWLALADKQQKIADALYGEAAQSVVDRAEELARRLYIYADAAAEEHQQKRR